MKNTHYIRQHLYSQNVSKRIIDEVIIQKAAQSYWPKKYVAKDGLRKVHNLTNSVINFFDEKLVESPIKWKQQKQAKVTPASLHLKTIYEVCNKKKQEKCYFRASSFSESQRENRGQINRQLLQQFARKAGTKKSFSKTSYPKQKKTSVVIKDQKLIPLAVPNNDSDNDRQIEFERFLIEQREKVKYILASNKLISKVNRRARQKLVKKYSEKKKNLVVTDYSGQSLIKGKAAKKNSVSQHVETTNTNNKQDQDANKKSEEDETDEILYTNNYRKIKIKLKECVKIIEKQQNSKTSNPTQNAKRKIKFRNYANLKEGDQQQQQFFDKDFDKKMISRIKDSQKSITMNKKASKEGQQNENTRPKGIRINSIHGLNILLNDGIQKSKKTVQIK